MVNLKSLAFGAVMAIGIAAVGLPSLADPYYTINGATAPYEWQLYMASNGLTPGDYWLTQDGYGGVMGSSQPMGTSMPAATSPVQAAANRAPMAGAT